MNQRGKLHGDWSRPVADQFTTQVRPMILDFGVGLGRPFGTGGGRYPTIRAGPKNLLRWMKTHVFPRKNDTSHLPRGIVHLPRGFKRNLGIVVKMPWWPGRLDPTPAKTHSCTQATGLGCHFSPNTSWCDEYGTAWLHGPCTCNLSPGVPRGEGWAKSIASTRVGEEIKKDQHQFTHPCTRAFHMHYF